MRVWKMSTGNGETKNGMQSNQITILHSDERVRIH